MLKDKYKMKNYLQDKYPHDPGGKDNYQIKKYLEQLYENINMFFTNKLPRSTDLHTAFQTIKLLIEKENLNLIHTKININISIIYQGKENWINCIMRCNSWTTKQISQTYIIYIYDFSSSQALHTSQNPYIQETRKFDT